VILVLSSGEEDTISAGRELGSTLRSGDVVLLEGTLGAGKTAFVRGMAEGLGCESEAVSSPTFTIVQEYSGRIRLQHVDLYRLSPRETDDLALDDLREDAVMAIEWPDRWRDAPDQAVVVTIVTTGDSTRRLSIVDRRDRSDARS
jgi:tRNA threonylcarbamoyladenosine biosynthesis protein TsaE